MYSIEANLDIFVILKVTCQQNFRHFPASGPPTPDFNSWLDFLGVQKKLQSPVKFTK